MSEPNQLQYSQALCHVFVEHVHTIITYRAISSE